jgi:carbamoyl-phosphate synthase small subunit
MTYLMIGNYGINEEDVESASIYLSALICKEYVDHPSNWQSVKTLKTYLEEHQRVGVERVDTRSLTLHVRDHGAQRMLITPDLDTPSDQLIDKIKEFPSMMGKNLVAVVSTDKQYEWPVSTAIESKFRIAVLDCGVKYNILRHFSERGCQCDVLSIESAQAAIESTT